MSMSEVNPSILFGGEWERINGRFLVGVGTTEDNTSNRHGDNNGTLNCSVGEKGGQANHTLTTAEMPSHSHRTRTLIKGWSGWGDRAMYGNDYSIPSWSNPKDYGGNTSNTNYSYTGFTTNVGDSVPHNNIPPYYAVYMWKRIR